MSCCPYCLNEINAEEVAFLLPGDFEKWEFYKKYQEDMLLDGFEGTEEVYMQQREDEKYNRFWDSRRKKGLDTTFRVWVDSDELIMFLNQFSEILGEDERSELDDEGLVSRRFKYGSNETTFSIVKTGLGRRLKISENGNERVSQMICPRCHNLIPEGFFSYPQINIGLIAKKAAGKTCMIISMLSRALAEINGSNKILSFEPMQNVGVDSNFAAVMREVDMFEKEGICPGQTNSVFMPPLVFKAIWRLENGERKNAVVCLYDAAGELLEQYAENAFLDGSECLLHIKKTNGWLFIIDPKDTVLQDHIVTDELKEKLICESTVFSAEEQIERQKEVNGALDSTVGDVMQRLLGQTDASTDIYQFFMNLRNYAEGNKPRIAFVLSKSDEVCGNTFLNKYDRNSLFFYRENIDYLSRESYEEDMYRQEQLSNFFVDNIIDIYGITEDLFLDTKAYIVSALGCSVKLKKVNVAEGTELVRYVLAGRYNPIRIGEPFVRLVMSLMGDKLG